MTEPIITTNNGNRPYLIISIRENPSSRITSINNLNIHLRIVCLVLVSLCVGGLRLLHPFIECSHIKTIVTLLSWLHEGSLRFVAYQIAYTLLIEAQLCCVCATLSVPRQPPFRQAATALSINLKVYPSAPVYIPFLTVRTAPLHPCSDVLCGLSELSRRSKSTPPDCSIYQSLPRFCAMCGARTHPYSTITCPLCHLWSLHRIYSVKDVEFEAILRTVLIS